MFHRESYSGLCTLAKSRCSPMALVPSETPTLVNFEDDIEYKMAVISPDYKHNLTHPNPGRLCVDEKTTGTKGKIFLTQFFRFVRLVEGRTGGTKG